MIASRHVLVLSAALVALPLPGDLRAQSIDPTIDRAVASYKSLKSTRATFEQTITNPLTGSTVTSRGVFEQIAPGRFAFRFSDPKGDRIIGDGKMVWLYLPSTNPDQVIRTPVTKGIGSLDIIGQFFNAPKTRFTISDGGSATINGHATRALILDPKSGEQSFAKATVWVDSEDGTLRQFETVEGSGVKRLVKIMQLDGNAQLDAGSFTFSPPRGVRVVDQ